MSTVWHFAVYRVADGTVLRAGKSTSPAIIEVTRAALREGEALFEGEIDPATTFLPGGLPTPKPTSNRIVTDLEVKAHAGRLLSYTDWVVVRAVDTGEPADPNILARRQAIRNASDALEAMDPIPSDFTDPMYWP